MAASTLMTSVLMSSGSTGDLAGAPDAVGVGTANFDHCAIQVARPYCCSTAKPSRRVNRGRINASRRNAS